MRLFVVVKCTCIEVIDKKYHDNVWLTSTEITSIHANYYEAVLKMKKLESENRDVNIVYDVVIEELES